MRLEGSLDAFSLPDIFQLLSYTKKTGGLHLQRPAQRGLVHVNDGAISAATAAVGRQALVRRLVGTGRVDEAGLERAAAAVAAEPGLSLVRALLRDGAVEEDDLRDAAREQVLDAVVDLLRWPDGDFSFVVDVRDPDGLELALPVDEVVAEARRRLSGWEAMIETVPGPGSVLAVAALPATAPAVSREEWAVLSLVDGRRTLAEVVDQSGLGELGVLQLVTALVQRGLLVDVAADESVPSLLRRQAVLARLEGSAGAPPVAQPPAAVEPPPVPVEQPAAMAPDDEDGPAPFDDDDVDRALDSARVAAALAGTPAPAVSPAPAASPAPSGAPAPAPRAPAPGLRPAEPLAARLEAAIPARPEPFNPRRRPEHPEDVPPPVAAVIGTAAVATEPHLAASPLIERDPSVNKSLLLRLIAGVRGL